MAKFKCKMCGAPLEVSEGQTLVTCAFCGSKQTVANADDERKENLFNRANELRIACEFDKAALAYQSILSIFPREPEAYWGLCICKYGIEYIDDPKSKKKIPTMHRVSFDSILNDSDYLSSLSYADVIAKEEYETEAKQISIIQKNILSISQKEEPFDIFICYKDVDFQGRRTQDSVLAQEIYTNLVDKGYKVFFSRITLENKLGVMYEPYIFAALNSAKIMIVVGTKKEYFEAIWVKNEWSRFIDLMKVRPDHYLIPCYKDINAYEMPEQFLSFQGQDMNRLGFMQDLLRGIDKIMGKNEFSNQPVETKIIQTDVNVPALLKRAEILISDKNYKKADELLERALNNDPTNSQAYLLKLLIELNLTSVEQLKDLPNTIESNGNFKKAYLYGTEQQKSKLNVINEYITQRNEEKRLERLYIIAMQYKNSKRYAEAEATFSDIAGYRDSNQQAAECVQLGKEDIYRKALTFKERKLYREAIFSFEKIKDFKDSKEQIFECEELINKEKYTQAMALKDKGLFDEASAIFMTILKYEDSDFQVDECARLKTEARKEEVYRKCVFDREINPYFDAKALKKACEYLATIPGYKNADALLVQYEGILREYEIELKKKRELAAREKAKKLKKVKKISFFSGLTSLALTAVLLLTFLFLIPQSRQNNIQRLINNKKYQEAFKLLEKNGSYGDSNNLYYMCKAGEAFENLDFETGIHYIDRIGGMVNINYDGDGGTLNKQTEILKHEKYVNNEADKNGYDFHGWVLTDYSMNAKKHNATIELLAKYEIITYNINYDLDGGICSNLVYSYNTEQSIYIPDPTKEGYTFLGWEGNDLDTPTKDLFLPIGSTGNKKYKAIWKANKYKVFLDANGGNVSINEIEVTYDSEYNLPQPSLNGYNFMGWYDVNSNLFHSSDVYKTANDVHLVAKWDTHYYVIHYNLNGGLNNENNPNSYTIEDSSITLQEPTKEGYSFKGWTNDEIKEPTKDVMIPSGTTGDLYFNAVWSANKYNVLINLNGGSAEQTSYEIQFDSQYYLEVPTRTGYSFDSFYYNGIKVNASGTWKIAKNVTLTAKWVANSNTPYQVNYYVEDLYGNGFTKVESEYLNGYSDSEITIFARKTYEGFTPKETSKNILIAADGSTVVDFFYSRNTYNLTFITNGGISMNPISLKYEENIPSSLVPDRVGLTFEGWYKDANQIEEFDKMPASDSEVYAYYKEETRAANFNYSFSGQNAVINQGNNLSGSVVIPEFIAGKKVSKINDNAFKDCTSITEITLPESVEELGKACFKGCTSLTRIKGTSNIITIENNTFEGCNNLAYFPDLSNVESIGDYAFKDCTSLTTIQFSDSIKSIGKYAFSNCALLLKAPDLSNVTYVGDYAFDGCKLLTEIKALNGCATLGEGILRGCGSIAKITLSFKENIEMFYVSNLFGTSVSNEDSSKYYGVSTNKGTHYVPNSLISIEYETTGKTPDYLLYGLKTITQVIDFSNESISIGKHAFDGCTALPFIKIMNNNVSLIDEYAFNNCISLNSLPSFDLNEVKKYAFANCESLLIAPNLVNTSYVGDYAFLNCSSIKEITMVNAVNLGENPLFGCSSLVEVGVAGNAINLSFGEIFGSTSFDNTYSYIQQNNTYYVPKSLVDLIIGGTQIKEGSFIKLYSIKNITILDTVESIGLGAFKDCSSLENITLPFVGNSENAEKINAVFGYIFGYTYTSLTSKSETNYNFTNTTFGQQINGATWQYSTSYAKRSYYYYIPTSLKSVIVTMQTKIPQAAFNGCSMLEKIDLLNSTESIGNYAFQKCSKLEKITLPNDLKELGSYAFSECKVLKQLNSDIDGLFNIPQTITKIGDYAFNMCSLASEITLSNDVMSIGDYAFAECSLVEKFNSATAATLVIPESCQKIGTYAFKNMTMINTIVVPTTVDSIGLGAFNGCNSLEDITLPFVGKADNAENIDAVFGYIFGYTTKSFSTGSIKKYNFFNKAYGQSSSGETWQYSVLLESESIRSFYYYIPAALKNVTVTMQTKIPLAAFNGCNMLEKIDLLNSTESIGDYAFQGCSKLEKITLPNDLKELGSYAFSECKVLRQINSEKNGVFNIPQTVTKIGDYAFNMCSLASEITLSNDVMSIGNYAFAECSLVEKFNSATATALVIPESCKTIGMHAFNNMSLIKEISISDMIETIQQGAFKGCNSLENITLPFVGNSENAENINAVFGYIFGYTYTSTSSTGETYYWFDNQKYGKEVSGATWQYSTYGARRSYYYYIPTSLKSVTVTMQTKIPLAAFNGCSMLEKIDLLNSVESIGNYAFQKCSKLEKITLPNDLKELGSYAFSECKVLRQFNSDVDGLFNIPQTVTKIGDYAFNMCSLASEITLSNDVMSIGDYAFAECSLVEKFNSSTSKTLTIPEFCQKIGTYAFKNMTMINRIVVPTTVDSIGLGAFNGCNSLENITLPFIGKADNAENVDAVFGYIFGYTTKSSLSGSIVNYNFVNKAYGQSLSTETWQYSIQIKDTYGYLGTCSYYYYIPLTLRDVTISMQTNIPLAAFNGCNMIESIHLVNCIESTGDYAFQNCNAEVDYLLTPSRSGTWDGKTIATFYHGGSGSSSDPFLIFNAPEFVYFMNEINNGNNYENTYFALTSNINLGNNSTSSTALNKENAFKGNFDGRYHRIYNLKIMTLDVNYGGIFGIVDGTIKNVGFENCTLYFYASKTIDESYMGGIVGELNGTLQNVYISHSNIYTSSTKTIYTGAIVGLNNGVISNVHSTSYTSAKSTNLKCYAGGVVGYNNGIIKYSIAYGNIGATGYDESYTYTSQFVGTEGNNSNITECYVYENMRITNSGSVVKSFNSVGTKASLNEIIKFCKLNWKDCAWAYRDTLPSF